MNNTNPVKKLVDRFAEEEALGQFLSFYPEEADYADVLERVRKEEWGEEDDSDLIGVYQPYEDYSGLHLSKLIEDHYWATKRNLSRFLAQVWGECLMEDIHEFVKETKNNV